MMLPRRDFLRRGAIAGGAMLFAPMINRGRYGLFGKSLPQYSQRAIDLVRESLVVDMLGLLTLNWPRFERWERQPAAFSPAEFEKLISSGISVFHPAVDLNARNPGEAFTANREWLRDWNVFFANHPNQLLRIERVSDLSRAKREGRIGVVLGFQNGDHFRTVEDVRFFYGMGQRISQLTYNAPNQVGAGCKAVRDTGLTEYGAAIVAAMNSIGMAVDVSHSSDCTATEAMRLSRKPVLITHTNCRALNPYHPRCVPDHVIRSMAMTGGVMGITGIRAFVGNQNLIDVETVLDHFDHVARIAGIEHVGLGSDSDLDGRPRIDTPGLNHPRRVYDLVEGLIRRRYSNREIALILGGNFRRALAEIWGDEEAHPTWVTSQQRE